MPPATLAGYSDAELLDFYNEADPAAREWRQLIEDEIDRRAKPEPEPEPVTRADIARLAERTEWYTVAHAQYLQAERDCRGELLAPEYRDRVGSAMELWSQPEPIARRWASEELRNWWDANGRLTHTEWRRQQTGARRQWQETRDRAAAAHEEGKTMGIAGRMIRDAVSAQGTGTGPLSQAAAQLAARAAELRSETGQTGGAAKPAEPSPGAALAVREGTIVAAARPHVDGDKMLTYTYTFLRKFAVWGSDAEIVAAALWIAQAHARGPDGRPVWQYSPRLGIFGPSGSGKSWKSRIIGKLAPAGKILLEPTKPSFLDLCADGATIILTEADELFHSAGRSRGILAAVNAGYEPDRTATRKHGGKVLEIPVFCPVVLDGLDTMLAANRQDLRTMISRCIIIRAQRADDGYRPPRFDGEARAIAGQIGLRLSAWAAQELADGMADTVPVVPDHLGNRPYALWEPLFVVAQHADGGDPDGPWSTACREACEILEAGGFPEPEPDGESELDRQMAEWAGAF